MAEPSKQQFEQAIKRAEQPAVPIPWESEQRYVAAEQRGQQLAAQQRSMPGGFGPGDRPLSDIPNYDKLTRFERTVMEALPGIANSKAGQFLSSLNEGWLGKVFAFIDQPREFAERTIGLGAQAIEASRSPEQWDDFTSNLAAAWHAGTFTADFANLPNWSDGVLKVPTDLPGVTGLVAARQQLALMAEQGIEMRDALPQIREWVYDNAGALALRMQWQDMMVGLAVDPLNWLLPILSPVEKAKAATITARAGRSAERTAEALAAVDRTADAMRAAGQAEDAIRFVEESRSAIEAIKEITPVQELILRVSGSADPKSFWGRIGRFNPFGMTAESRAREAATNLTDNLLSLIGRGDMDVEEAVRLVQAAADGTFDPRIAHLWVSEEGRMVRSLLQGTSAQAQDLVNAFRGTANERNFVGFMARTLGENADDMMVRVFQHDEATALLARVAEKANPEDMARLAAAIGLDPKAMTAEALIGKLEPLYRSGLLSQDALKTNLLIGIADVAGRALVVKYGVKESGFLVKLGEAMKSAESLAFIRGNPGYVMRNLLNNEITVAARVGLSWSKKAADDFVKALGFEPARMRQGFGMAGIAQKVASGDRIATATAEKFNEVIGDAVRGERGWLDKAKEFFNGANLGKLDMAQASSRFEASASERAYVAGMMRFRRKYMQFTRLSDEARDALIPLVGDDGARTIERALKEALSDADVDRILFSENAHLSPQAVLDNAAQRFGTDLDDVIPVEELDGMVAQIADGFREGGETGARDAAARIRSEMQQRLASGLEEELVDIAEDVATRVRVGGPDETMRQMTEGVDVFWGEAHAQYAQEFGVAYDAIRNAPKESRPALWAAAQERARAFFDDKWKILESRANGIEEGIARLERETGQRFPFRGEYRDAFRQWKNGWRDFYKYRDTQIEKWVSGGADYEDIVGKINAAYEKAIAGEERTWLHMDEVVAQMVPPQAREMYMAGRSQVADWRRAMRDYVVQFQQNPLGDGRAYVDLGDLEKQQAYRQFWQVRNDLLGKVKDAEDQLKAAMIGVRQAADDLNAKIAFREVEDPVARGFLQKLQTSQDAFDVRVVQGPLGAEEGRFALARVLWRQRKPGERAVMEVSNVLFRQGPEEIRRILMEEVAHGLEPMGYTDDLAALFGEGEANLEKAIDNVVKLALGEEAEHADDLARMLADEPELTDALRALAEHLTEATEPPGDFVWNALPDVDGVLKRPMPKIAGEHELWYSRGSRAVDSIVDAAVEQGRKRALKFEGLTSEGQRAVRQFAAAAKANLSSQRYQMVKFGEWMRDSALLNYQRRLNYNTWLGTMMPYEFWGTTSIRYWALHSIDRPFVAMAYVRMQRFLEQGFRPEYGLPSRLRHNIRIKVPFLPEWMGKELFVNPLGAALPFASWRQQIEQFTQQKAGDEYRATNVLKELYEDGTISEQEYQQALQSKSGPTWDRAIALARQDDTEGRLNAMDVLSVLSSPHAPVVWAYNALSGHPEKIGAFTPIERSIKGLTALLGIGPAGGLNPLGAARQHFGLPAFDQWDDYRIDRMLSNMAGDGTITVEQAKRAMVERQGFAFEEAKHRAGQEYGVGVLGSIIGIPTKAYPPGEERLRKMKDEYEAAWTAYEAGDLDALKGFYDAYPEYETRLALWDKPEERLQRFVTDEIWSRWNDLPVQHKREVSEQLGELFQTAFLDRETRSIENIPLDTLQAWLAIMGGDPPGQVHWDQDLHPLSDLTDPDIAQRLEAFYRTRSQVFNYNENVAPLMDEYFRLDKQGRKQFLRDHPALKQYWDWRRDFMIRNPTLAPYIEDDPEKLPKYSSEAELEQAQAAEPNFTWFEYQSLLGTSTWRLVYDTMALGLPINKATEDELETIAASLGIDADRLLGDMSRAYQESQ